MAEKYNNADDQEVVIAKVDCTTERALCSGTIHMHLCQLSCLKILILIRSCQTKLFSILAQGVRGYPTMKLYKPAAGSGVEYNGRRNFDSLVAFIDEQMMGTTPAK